MSKRDEIQTVINQASLMMNTHEDIVRAVKIAEVHPTLAEVLIRLHATQEDMDRRMRATDRALVQVAQYIEQNANITESVLQNLQELNRINNTAAEDAD
jgi:hypothetical protein